ncbi:unnamed protein product [Closterium sp. Naga37s-1]|nr:unnamed protein product [Closterium sp. Naga37s-1]
MCGMQGALGGLRFVLKRSIARVPLVGWALQMLHFVFIDRCWRTDEAGMGATLQQLRACAGQQDGQKNGQQKHRSGGFWLAIFPEGTDFTSEFARARGLPVLQHVLLPRTRGTYLCLHSLHSVFDAREPTPPVSTLATIHLSADSRTAFTSTMVWSGLWTLKYRIPSRPLAVIDVTVAYDKGKGGMHDLLKMAIGHGPRRVFLQLKLLPVGAPLALSQHSFNEAMIDIYSRKDALLSHAYAKGTMPPSSTLCSLRPATSIGFASLALSLLMTIAVTVYLGTSFGK